MENFLCLEDKCCCGEVNILVISPYPCKIAQSYVFLLKKDMDLIFISIGAGGAGCAGNLYGFVLPEAIPQTLADGSERII